MVKKIIEYRTMTVEKGARKACFGIILAKVCVPILWCGMFKDDFIKGDFIKGILYTALLSIKTASVLEDAFIIDQRLIIFAKRIKIIVTCPPEAGFYAEYRSHDYSAIVYFLGNIMPIRDLKEGRDTFSSTSQIINRIRKLFKKQRLVTSQLFISTHRIFTQIVKYIKSKNLFFLRSKFVA